MDMPEKTSQVKKTSPRDFFLHVLAIVTLYIVAGSFLALLFQYINVYFPDKLDPNGYIAVSAAYSTIRWSIASLIIVYPLYLWVSWFLEKGYQRFPEKRQARIRKWLVYFTLFAAAIAIMVDLITLIFQFLGGDLTTRFALKVFSVLLVAGIVFGYYLWDVRRNDQETL